MSSPSTSDDTMLKITKAQLDTLKQGTSHLLERSIFLYLHKTLPIHLSIIGEEAARQVIKQGMIQANDIGFIRVRELKIYICAMFLMGSHFNMDPQYDWAQRILSREQSWAPDERADCLFDEVAVFAQQLAGPGNTYFLSALDRVKNLNTNRLPQASSSRYQDDVLLLLHSIFPQKAAFLGEARIRSLSAMMYQKAKLHGCAEAGSGIGAAYITVCGFLFGASCDTDPMYSWLGQIIHSKDTPSQKIIALHRATISYLDQWMYQLSALPL